MEQGVQEYVDRISAAHRPLFDRLHGLIMTGSPQATVSLSYRMPTYKVGRRRLYVGAWAHGISLYGWPQGRDGGFAERHPDLLSGKATIRITPGDAAALSDQELTALIQAALED